MVSGPRWRRAARASSLIALLACGSIAVAGPAWAEDAKSETPTQLEIKIAESVTVGAFLAEARRVTGYDLRWNHRTKRMSATISGPLEIRGTREQLLDATRAIIAVFDLVFMEAGTPPHQFTFIDDARATNTVVRMRSRVIDVTDDNVGDLDTRTGEYVTTFIRLKHIDQIRETSATLKRLVTPSNVGFVQEIPAQRMLIVSDFAPNVASIYRLLRAIDRPKLGLPKRDATVKLNHADAEQAADVVRSHFEQLRHQPDVHPNARRVASTIVSSTRPRFQVTGDPHSCKVFLSGAEDDVASAQRMLAEIDVPAASTAPSTPKAEHKVTSVKIQHANPESLGRSLQDFIAAGTHWGDVRPAAIQDSPSKTIFLTGTASQLEQLRSFIQTIDVAPASAADAHAR